MSRATRRTAAAMVAMTAVGLVIIVARRPDAITNPQFWAEDGRSWFEDAYNSGLAALVKGAYGAGYMLTLPRLVAAPVAGLSLGRAALVFNLVGIAVQLAPAVFFLSRRFERVAPRAWVRGLLAVAYLLIPSFELDVNLTNAQWHLALLAIMVLVAQPPRRALAHGFDLVVLLLCGLTGPFALVLLPAAVARAVTVAPRRRWFGGLSAMLGVTLVIQAVAVLNGRNPVAPLGVSFADGVTMLADRVVLPATFAEEGHAHVFTAGSPGGIVLATIISAVAVSIIGLAVARGGASLRIFVLTCLGLTVLCLLSPSGTAPGMTSWHVLATSSDGARYFLIAEVAWLVCLVWAVSRVAVAGVRRLVGVALVAMFASGLIASWSYPAFADLHPAQYTLQLRAASPGTRVIIPINPGGGWEMTLIRQ